MGRSLIPAYHCTIKRNLDLCLLHMNSVRYTLEILQAVFDGMINVAGVNRFEQQKHYGHVMVANHVRKVGIGVSYL